VIDVTGLNPRACCSDRAKDVHDFSAVLGIVRIVQTKSRVIGRRTLPRAMTRTCCISP